MASSITSTVSVSTSTHHQQPTTSKSSTNPVGSTLAFPNASLLAGALSPKRMHFALGGSPPHLAKAWHLCRILVEGTLAHATSGPD
ncbi:hypothetical protein G7Z17_g8209 [Cylindrodendrum hubeiense]|uniref:Uncharacterized protein n=1 Tax=Cylindrodendrum hubeiense TaxID=595255 RepID=A0A9P5L6Q7_9HYPO|nr:hypothetical protein G7Z17_g8209 [Cylindrodendrum hubeiense]